MTDSEFLDQAERVLQSVEAACDRFNDLLEVDIDNQRVGSMVTLRFQNNSQIVINLQKPLHEIWMATPSGGYHYRLLDGKWENTKGGADFFAELTHNASQQAATPLRFANGLSS